MEPWEPRNSQKSLTFQSDAADSEADFCPARLGLARRRRGLTKTDLAREIGLDVRTISGYEAGEFPPSPSTLQKLSEVLRFPEAFFCGLPLQEPRPDTASFRAQSKMTAAQRDMALSQGAIALALDTWINQRFELPPVLLPHLDKHMKPEEAAQAVRQEWGLGMMGIRNMVHLLESKGIRIFALSVRAKEVDAFSLWQGDTPYIFLNTQKSAEHSRFDAAHELGHLILHRHAAPQGRRAEKEADDFASAFLMPRESVLAHIPKLATVDQLIRYKKIWAVSAAALAYRYHHLKAISDWTYRTLYIQLSKLGYTRQEPEPIPHESSQVLRKVFQMLDTENISRKQIARELYLHPLEFEDLLLGLTFSEIEGGSSTPSSGRHESSALRLVKS